MNLRIALTTALTLTLVPGCDSGQPNPDTAPTEPGTPQVYVVPPTLAVVTAVTAVPAVPAPPLYYVPPSIDTEMPLEGLTVVDLDGDGVDELVASDGLNIASWASSPDGLVPSGLIYESDTLIERLYPGDFDGDGAQELLLELETSWRLLDQVDGQMVVSHSVDRNPYIGETGLTVADINADGRDDLIVYKPACATLAPDQWSATCKDRHYEILLGGGQDGIAVLPVELAYGSSMMIADLNGDGHSEGVRCTWDKIQDGPERTFMTVVDLGSGDGSVLASDLLVGVRLTQPWTGDLNGDGVLEVLSVDVLSNTVFVFSYQNGVLTRHESIEQMGRFEAVDLGGDAGAELIAGSKVLEIYPTERLEGDVAPTTYAGGAHVVLMDADQDGWKDVVTAQNDGRIQTLFADGAGGLEGLSVVPTTQWIGTVQTADVDEDGRPDVVGTRADGKGTALLVNDPEAGVGNVALNLGHYAWLAMDCAESSRPGGLLCAGSRLYGFAPYEDGEMGATDLTQDFFIPCGQDSWEAPIPHLGVGDFDGDGLEDVVVSMQQFTVRPVFFNYTNEYWNREGTVLFFRGTVDGGFEYAQYFQRDTLSTDVVAMDLDKDGVDELVITDASGALETWRLTEGAWSMVAKATHEEAMFGLEIAHTEQGPLLLARTGEAGQVLVFQPTPAGQLVQISSTLFPGSVVSITLSDIDQDGDEDLIVATADEDGIWASLQTEGEFGEPVALVQTGLTPASIDMADVDLDGCPDIVASFKGVKGIVTLKGQCKVSE